MAGDHKCPVCQSTFTRPQHVARHMRSRKQTVSLYQTRWSHPAPPRRVRAILGSDDPPQTLATDLTNANSVAISSLEVICSHDTSTSATRARNRFFRPLEQGEKDLRRLHAPQHPSKHVTTKCNQRKMRCTFVKFHRQTAPVGPGHNPPQSGVLPLPTPTSSVSSSSDDSHPGPSPLTVPSMTENIFSNTFLFPLIYPDNAHTELVPTEESRDFPYRYHARSDLLKQAEVPINASSSHPFSDPRRGWGGATAGTSAWDHPRFRQEKTHRHYQQLRPYPPSDISTAYRRSMQRPASEFDLDLDFSDGSSANSIPSSSPASSEVHLPSPPAAQATGTFISSDPAFSQRPLTDPTPSSFHPHPLFHPSSTLSSSTTIVYPTSAHTTASAPPISKPNKSFDESSFGALSLDDPALSLTTDVSPFFSDVLTGSHAHGSTVLHDPDATPMQPHSAEGAGDAELWRAFMRSTPIGEEPHSHSHSQHQSQNRRASVPTPNIGRYHASVHPQDLKHPNTLHPPFHQPRYVSHAAPPQTQQPDDDLSRYHQAILARARETETVLRPPPDARSKIQLRVQPRRGVVGTRGSTRPGSSGSEASVSSFGAEAGTGVEGEGEREREGKGGQVRPGFKRGLSGTIRGDSMKRKSQRRIGGGEEVCAVHQRKSENLMPLLSSSLVEWEHTKKK
ncbi:hypothetical protein C0995_007384 [Termitomyces sp. Mi166|nr:hypothetical protein C0995_007384 [Termitomyces sp. Mi166\